MKFWHKKVQKSNTAVNTAEVEKLKSDIILNSIEDGVVLIDPARVIQLLNPAGSRITGWVHDEAVGIDCIKVLQLVNDKGNPYPNEHNPFVQVLATGKSMRDNKAVLITRSKKNTAVNLSVSPLLGSNRQITGVVAIFQDVSEERQEQRRRAEFISTASHEMRTPVAAIEGYLALAMNDKVSKIDAKARDYLQKAHQSTQHLGQLFQDLLTSAKAEDGRLTSHPTVVEFGKYLEQLAQDLKFSADKKGLSMEFVVGTGASSTIDARDINSKVIQPLYYVYADADRLREVVTNLFDNAVKYTASGKVSIGITGNNDVVQFYVRDTGAGIPTEDIPHLFGKFYRVDNSATRSVGGTGLGLFICRKIVELYQGRIWTESELGKGSTFFINLPRISAERANQLKTAEAGQGPLVIPKSTSVPG